MFTSRTHIASTLLLLTAAFAPAVSQTQSAYGDVERSVGNRFQAASSFAAGEEAPVQPFAALLLELSVPVVAGTSTEVQEPSATSTKLKVEVSEPVVTFSTTSEEKEEGKKNPAVEVSEPIVSFNMSTPVEKSDEQGVSKEEKVSNNELLLANEENDMADEMTPGANPMPGGAPGGAPNPTPNPMPPPAGNPNPMPPPGGTPTPPPAQ
jgi:hypothetical protein